MYVEYSVSSEGSGDLLRQLGGKHDRFKQFHRIADQGYVNVHHDINYCHDAVTQTKSEIVKNETRGHNTGACPCDHPSNLTGQQQGNGIFE